MSLSLKPMEVRLTGRPAVDRELAEAPEDIRERIRWLPLGVPTELTA
jgi:hypothetical protein